MPRHETRPIVFSHHAAKRMAQRQVRQEDAERAIRTGRWEANGAGAGELVATAFVNGHTLLAPLAVYEDRIVVKTIFWLA